MIEPSEQVCYSEDMKKSILVVLSIVALQSSTVFACSPYTAQFIGKVTEAKKYKSGSSQTCWIKIGKFRFFNESYICPLDIDGMSSTQFPDVRCKYKVGDEISGVAGIDENDKSFLD